MASAAVPEIATGRPAEDAPPARLPLEEAVEQIPRDLRDLMEERLRARFREVVDWRPEPR